MSDSQDDANGARYFAQQGEATAVRLARIDERLRSQKEWNACTDETLERHDTRISAIEYRVMWAAGFASALGGLIGWGLTLLAGR